MGLLKKNNKLECIGITKLSAVYAHCVGHTDCKVRWKNFHASKEQIFELHRISIDSDVGLIFFQRDNHDHAAQESPANVKWIQAAYLDDLMQSSQVE